MNIEEKYKMFKKLLSTLLPKKFPEVESVEVENMSEDYRMKEGIFNVVIYVDGTEYQQEQDIEEYIKQILDHTGENFNYLIGYVTL